jgi:carbon monoxide dehydrogenase subunit G
VAPIVAEVDVARPADEVFRYVTDPSRFGEWQSGVVSAHIEGDGPQAVGSLCIMTRRIGGSERTSTSKVTELSPPRRWAIRGIDGPIRANITVTVDEADQGAHVAIEVDFTGHGLGKMILTVVIREAGKEVPESCQKLKSRLEAGAA